MGPLVDFSNLVEMFDKVTRHFLDTEKDALQRKVSGKYTGIKYRELRENVKNFALGLASLDIRRGDMVAIISENRPEWVYADMGMLCIGAIDVPLYPSSTANTVEFILNNSESKAIIISNKLQLIKVQKIKDQVKSLKHLIVINQKDASGDVLTMDEVMERGKEFEKSHPYYFEDEMKKVNENDLATLIYTSGTTGDPKGVMLTHSNFVSNIKASLSVIPFDETDTLLSFLPLSHVFERMAGYYTSLAAGATIAYADSIDTVSENMTEVKPTVMTTVPRLFERMYSKVIKNVESSPPAKQKIFHWAIEVGRKYAEAQKQKRSVPVLSVQYKLASKLVFEKIRARTGGRLRFFVSGGAALSRVIGEFFEAMGIKIIEGYGLTETSPVITCNRVDDYKFGTVGKPIPGVEVKIAQDGEILTRGPHVMQGYYKNKKATEETINKDGWLHTGDIGVFDAQGFLIITDRKKHLFKTSGGKYIAPQPLENLFQTSKYIDQFVLIGDNKTFLSALITPDFEAIKEYADTHRIPYETTSDLVKSPEIYDLIEKDIANLQKDLAAYERVRKFVLLEKPFTIDDGELTPSLKIRRKLVEERYSDLINSMYLTSGKR